MAVLVAEAQTGSDGALERLIQRYQDRIAGFVYSLVGEKDSIEDLCNSVFVRMITGLAGLRAPQSFESWLFRIARNICFDHLRKQRLRRLFVPLERKHEQIEAPAWSPDMRLEAFKRALAALPAKQRELIVLLQDRDWSYEELARITGATLSSIKARLFRARAQLKRKLNEV